MHSCWNRAVHAKLWPVSSCDNDVMVTPQSLSFCHVTYSCFIYLSQLVSVLCLGCPADMVGFHFRQELSLNGDSKLWNIYNFFKKDRQADSLSQNFACEQNSTTVITSETRPCLMDVQTRNIFHGSRISISVESSKSSHVTTASFLLSRVTLWLFTSLGCCSSQTHDEAVVSTNVCAHSVKWPSSTMFV